MLNVILKVNYKGYIKIHGPLFPKTLCPHTFLHRVDTSGLKVRLLFKKFIFHKVENRKS